MYFHYPFTENLFDNPRSSMSLTIRLHQCLFATVVLISGIVHQPVHPGVPNNDTLVKVTAKPAEHLPPAHNCLKNALTYIFVRLGFRPLYNKMLAG